MDEDELTGWQQYRSMSVPQQMRGSEHSKPAERERENVVGPNSSKHVVLRLCSNQDLSLYDDDARDK